MKNLGHKINGKYYRCQMEGFYTVTDYKKILRSVYGNTHGVTIGVFSDDCVLMVSGHGGATIAIGTFTAI
jgi:hypothetical protein